MQGARFQHVDDDPRHDQPRIRFSSAGTMDQGTSGVRVAKPPRHFCVALIPT